MKELVTTNTIESRCIKMERINFNDICDDVLRYGEVIKDDECKAGNCNIRYYKIMYEGDIFEAIKINGDWGYLLHIK